MERHRPSQAPAQAPARTDCGSRCTAFKLTAVLGVALGLLVLPAAASLSTVLGPFSWPSSKSTPSTPVNASPRDPGPGQPSFALPAIDGGGFPGGSGYMYSTPIAPFSHTPTGDIPPVALAAYQRAAQVLAARLPQCHLGWPLLAGIGKVESDHAGGGELQPDGTAVVPILGPELNGSHGNRAVRDTDHGVLDADLVWDRAVGPMQILPSIWRRWGATYRQGAEPNPQNIFDATLTAGDLLCAGGRDLSTPAGLQGAVYAYNHAPGYVDAVLAWTAFYAAEALPGVTAGGAQPPSLPLLPSGAPLGAAPLTPPPPWTGPPTSPAAVPATPETPATTSPSVHGSTGPTPPGRPSGNPPSPTTGVPKPSLSPSPRRSSPSQGCPCHQNSHPYRPAVAG